MNPPRMNPEQMLAIRNARREAYQTMLKMPDIAERMQALEERVAQAEARVAAAEARVAEVERGRPA